MKEGWIRVFSANEMFKVKIAEDKLKQHGIESHIVNQGDSAIPSIGQVELFAPKEKATDAVKILREADIRKDD